jgi:hypothetical protein
VIEQEVFDVNFTWIVECERTLDDVIVKLADVGVAVKPEQRVVVARWLDLFSESSPVPLGYRLMMLRGMLEASDERGADGG